PSKSHGAAARSVVHVSPARSPATMPWISWSTDGSIGRGRMRTAGMASSIRVSVRERATVGELDGGVVAVQPGGPVAAGPEPVGGDEGSGVLDLAAEVRGIERAVEDGLVHLAQLSQGELRREEAVCDAAVAHLVAQAPQGVLDDVAVVERE